MANNKDNNADLGNQTIEGTEPPIIFDAEIVMPDGSSQPLFAQPANANGDAAVIPPVTPEPAPISENLDAMLEAMLSDTTVITPDAQPSAKPADNAQPDSNDLDAQLAAMLGDEPIIVTPAAEPVITPDAQPFAMPADNAQPAQPDTNDLDAQLAAMLGDEPIIVTPAAEPVITPDAQPFAMPADSARPAQPDTNDLDAQLAAAMSDHQPARAEAEAPKPETEAPAGERKKDGIDETTARLLEMMKGLSDSKPAPRDDSAETAKIMMEQARLMMEQAQKAQPTADNRFEAPPVTTAADAYANKEVDKLKAELDSMRDLVSKLTFSMAQPQTQNVAAQAPPTYFGNDPYRRLEKELDSMRREIIEKELRDKEKELERKQKEADNVKDIRPEMVQMSDSRDIAPVSAMPQGGFGNEYIPLANGVFYSTKDRQIYVLTPAAAAQSAVTKPAPAKPRPTPRPAARKSSARAKSARRRPAHGRPTRAPRSSARPRPKR